MPALLKDRRAIDSGLAFLEKELEKTDSKILEPLSSVTYARDMPIRTGGGIVESVRAIAVNYGTAGSADGEGSIIGGDTNNIPVMQADLSEDTWKTYIFAETLKIGFFDDMKAQKIGRSLQEMLDKGIHLHYDKYLDKNVYVGMQGHGGTGLINNANVSRYARSINFAVATPDDILAVINEALLYTWERSEYDLSGMANHILLAPSDFAKLVHRKVGVTGDKSILTFLMENNIGKDRGQDLSIEPCVWCAGAGTGNTDRMVCYANNEDRIRMDVTLPLKRWITEASAKDLAYFTPYYAQYSEVQFLYLTPVVYVDILPASAGEMATITVESAAGTAAGDTALTLSGYTQPASESYVYKVGETAPSLEYGEVPDYSWTSWDGASDITAATGKKITVASITALGQAVAIGSATVTAHA